MALLNLVKQGTKLTVAGGALWWSYDQGIWGTMDEGSEALKRLQDAIISSDNNTPAGPVREAAFSTPVPQPIENQEYKTPTQHSPVKDTWNSGVRSVFQYLSNLPETTVDAAKKATSSIKSFADGE